MTLKNFSKLFAFFIGIHSICFAQPSMDLTLRSATVNPRVEIGNEGTITFTLENQGTANATGVKVFVNIPYFPPFVRFVSAVGSKGTFDVNSGLWTIESLIGHETAILTMKYVPMEHGVWYAEAEVYSANEIDLDSTPNNNIDAEDDFTRSCFSMPIKVSSPTFGGRQIIMNDPKITNIVWRKDGQVIAGQSSNTLQITSTGSYSYDSPTFKCPTQGCCPFIFEEGPQTLCCEPLEYGLERLVSGDLQSQLQQTLIIQPNSETGKDAIFTSVVPNQNLGDWPDLEVLAWTWNSANLGAGSRRAVMFFDLNEIPTNALISEAKLELFFNKTSQSYFSIAPQVGANTSNQSVLRTITEPWEELGVNWSNQPSTTTKDQVFIPSNTGLENDVVLDVTNLVRNQLTNPQESFGFMMSLVTEEFYRSMLFASSDHIDPSKRPKLTVKYSVVN